MKRLIALLAVVLGLSASAQDTVGGFRNNLKLSLQPLLTASPVVCYEHSLPHHQSVELTMGGHVKLPLFEGTILNIPYNFDQVLFAQAGYKYTFDRRGTGNDAASDLGLMTGGWYVKGFVGVNRFWRSLDCFVGNQGQTIFTEKRTFHATTLSFGLLAGRQFVMDNGFVIDIFMGLSIPKWYYGPEEWREYCQMNYTCSSFMGFTQGVRLGWCF